MFDIYKIKEINEVIILIIVCINNVKIEIQHDMKNNPKFSKKFSIDFI